MTKKDSKAQAAVAATLPNAAAQFAADELAGKLLHMCVAQLESLKNPWSMTSEANQEIAINAMREGIKEATHSAVMVIATQRAQALRATVEGVNFKDGIKATLSLSKVEPGRHDLADAEGSTVLIIIANPEQFTGGTEKVTPQPDQKSLLEPSKYEIVPPKDGFMFRVLKDGMPIAKAPKRFDTHEEAEKWLQDHLDISKKKDPEPPVDVKDAGKKADGKKATDAKADNKDAPKTDKPVDWPFPPNADDAAKLKSALDAFAAAGKEEAAKPISDWDNQWNEIAGKYPPEYVEEHYTELSKAFADGWEEGQG